MVDKDLHCRRQSVISCSSQREWVFEENTIKDQCNSMENQKTIEQGHGCVQVAMQNV